PTRDVTHGAASAAHPTGRHGGRTTGPAPRRGAGRVASTGMSDPPSLLRTLRQGRYLRLAAVCLLAAVVCAAAGVWQYHRWQGKHGANAELRGSAAAAPVPVGTLLATDRTLPATDRFRLVTARGSWDAAGELYVRQRRATSERASLVVPPLRTADGPPLLVVRGWRPATGSAPQRPVTPAPPAGEVTITGRAYPSETGGLGAGLPDRQIQRIDTAAIGPPLANGPGGGAGDGAGSGPGGRPGEGAGRGPGGQARRGPGGSTGDRA